MSFFYDLNKKLDGIRATPEVTHKQLNERDEGKHNNATTGFKALASKAAKEYGSQAAGERVAGAVHAKMAKAGKLEEYDIGEGAPMSPKQKSFAKLAPPADKITFADKIAGAKKEVDEMLGDVAAEAMKKALGGGRGRDQEMEEASTGNAFDWKNRKEPEVHKSASLIHKGTYGTEYDGDKEDAKALATKKRAAADAGQAQRGRGRPKNNASADTGEVMKPDWSAYEKKIKLKPHTGKVTKHKMVGEDDLDPEDQGEYDQEGQMAKDDIKTIVRHAQALEKVLGDNDNLPEWVQAKLAKIEGMMTAVDDYMQNQAGDDTDDEQEPIAEKAVSKKQQRFMGMVHATQKGEKAPSKEVSKVAKSMKKSDATDFASTKQKGLPEKAPKKKKEEDVEESTTSGSVATSAAAPKAAKGSGGFTFGKGIYDSMNRELEDMIAESMSINMSDSTEGGKSLTVTATDEDAMKLAMILKSAGLGNSAAQETCSTCGGTDCGCDAMDESYGDDVVSQNTPDYPTNTEKAHDNFEYSGGLNKPKSTGQTTVPVIAGQGDRTDSYAESEQDALHRMMEMAGMGQTQLDEGMMDKLKSMLVPKLMKMLGADAEKIASAVRQATGGDLTPSKENAMKVVQALGIDKAATQGQSPQMAEGIAGNWQGKLIQAMYTLGLLGSAGAAASMWHTVGGSSMTVIGILLLMFANTFFGDAPGQIGTMGNLGNKGTGMQRGLDIHGRPEIDPRASGLEEQDALHRMMEMSGIREAKVKPDFLDIDKDGDKDESMKKAVDDKKTKVEESDTEFSEGIQRMREIAGIAQEGKVIDALKSGAKKVLDVVTGPDDDELLARLDKDVHGGKVPNRYNSDSESAKKYPADSWKAKQVEESIFDLTNQWKAYKG